MASTGEQDENAGIYQLLTELCNKTASNYCVPSKAHKRLASKMRSQAYEIILKKPDEVMYRKRPPVSDLLLLYITNSNNAKNVAEYKRALELKAAIETIKETDFGDSKDHVNDAIRLLVGLSNSVKEDFSADMYQVPMSITISAPRFPVLRKSWYLYNICQPLIHLQGVISK